MEKVKGFLVAIIAWLLLALLYNQANAYVTLDVDKWNGPSGTYKCVDAKTCWLLWKSAEERGDTYYCNSVVMKHDGKVIWFRNYHH